MATVRLQQDITVGTMAPLSKPQSFTCPSLALIDGETIAVAASDVVHLFAVDNSALQVFYMVADQVLTIDTNSAVTPQETFTLVANKPVIFVTGDTAIFAGDVTQLTVSNASGVAATLYAYAGMNV